MPAQLNTAPLEVRDLRVSYGPTRAVDGVSLEVRAGEIFGLLGPNGAGKTTTLSAIEGLLEPDSGSVTIGGIDRRASPRAAKARIGVQLQSTGFQSALTIAQITRLYAALYGVAMSRQGSRDVLRSMGLEDEASKRFGQLSGGQQKRLSLVIATIHDPPLVLLDEPTAGLDPQARRQLWNRIEKMRESGRSVLLTTHSMEEAQAVCDRVAIIDHGKIVTVDTPAGLIEKHKDDPRVTSIAHGQVTLDDVFIGLTGETFVTEASAQAAGPRPAEARGALPALGPTLAALLEVDFSVQLRNYRSVMLSLVLPVVVLVALFANKRAAALADPRVRVSLVMILGMATIAIFGYALNVATDREAGVFQRLRVTPAPAWAIMMSRLVVQVAVILLMAIVVLVVARIFQNVTLDALAYGLTLAVVIAGSAVFLAIGQALVGLVRSAETLNAVSRLVYIPLVGLGLLGRTDILGSTVADIARWSPGGIVATLLAAAMEPATWGSDGWWSLLACVGYTTVFVFLGIRWFRWGAH